MRYAISYRKPGTTLTVWLNQRRTEGYVWSVVRSSTVGPRDDQYWNQPPLRFDTQDAAFEFIEGELGGNPDACAVQVEG